MKLYFLIYLLISLSFMICKSDSINDECLISHIEFNNEPLKKALQKILNTECGRKSGLKKIEVVLYPEKLSGFKKQIYPKLEPIPLNPKVYLSIKNIDVVELIRVSARMGNFQSEIKGDVVLVYPNSGTFGKLKTEVFYRTSNSKYPFIEKEWIDYFVKQGVVFYEGSKIEYLKSDNSIRITNTEDQLDLISGMKACSSTCVHSNHEM